MIEQTARLEAELKAWGTDLSNDVNDSLRQHIATGIRRVVKAGDQQFCDPNFAYASTKRLDVVFNDGARFDLEIWGNTDGAGIVEEPIPSFVPAVADVLTAMRDQGISQDRAVVFLGGIA
jgi:hypothetical protein